jgi:hypothetical protein
MFKNLTMLAGAAAGVSMAVAVGAPSPHQLLDQLTGQKPGANCQVSWETGDQSSGQSAGPHTGRVRDLRAGPHRCYDRIVIDLGPGQQPGYQVRYVAEVHSQGSGNPIPLRGRAQLLVQVDANARPSFPASSRELANVSGFSVLRQVAGAGSFEGVTDIGVGVKGKRPFRVRLLSGPGQDSRLVIDVARHR